MVEPDKAVNPEQKPPSTFTDPSQDSGNSLLPMLISGLVLVVVGGLVVVAFVF